MDLDDAIDIATSLVIENGCSDITTENLEITLIKEFKNDFKKDISRLLKKSSIDEMEFRPIQYILAPKNRYVFDYRKAAIIEPACTVKYLAIVLQYADLVEEHRVATDKGIVFSARFQPHEKGLFKRDINYSSWKDRTKELASNADCNFIVSCDIAAFYDRINIHRIESTLSSIGVDPRLIKHTNDLLLFWSKKDSYGIPVGNDASRILSEVALIDIDEYLLSEEVLFTRYVDDYRLFAPDLLTAQKWMNKLTTRLFRDGLMLNISKTGIREKKEDNEKTEEVEPTSAAEEVLKVVTKLSGGYSRIVRRFIMPSAEKHEPFKKIDIEQELSKLKETAIVEFVGVQKVVIAALVQERYDLLIDIAQTCTKYLYSLDYFIDMLLKNSKFIPEDKRKDISDFYGKIVNQAEFNSFDWHCASIAKLLSSESYFNKEPLIDLFRNTVKENSSYPSMIALEGLTDNVTRSEFRTIRELFDRSDSWEKRRIAWISRALPDDERKAWAKAIKSTVSGDILCYSYVNSIIKDRAI